MYNGLQDGKHEYRYLRSISTGRYDISPEIAQEIEAALPGKVFRVYMDGIDVYCRFDDLLSSAEEAILNQVVVDHSATFLAMTKEEKNAAIDLKTKALICQGFTFDGAVFSLSLKAQINWLGIKTLEALTTWPVTITTIDDNSYSLAQADLDSFMSQALGTKQSHLDSGRALKVQVNAATTVEGVDAVVDNR